LIFNPVVAAAFAGGIFAGNPGVGKFRGEDCRLRGGAIPISTKVTRCGTVVYLLKNDVPEAISFDFASAPLCKLSSTMVYSTHHASQYDPHEGTPWLGEDL
jgi:hypothetical protein